MPGEWLQLHNPIKIHKLRIENCSIKEITAYAFDTESLEKLETLEIIGNDLETISDQYQFSGLPYLRVLKLVSVPLKSFSTECLALCGKLKYIEIESNPNKDFIFQGRNWSPYEDGSISSMRSDTSNPNATEQAANRKETITERDSLAETTPISFAEEIRARATAQQLSVTKLVMHGNNIKDSIDENTFFGYGNAVTIELARNNIEFIAKDTFTFEKFPILANLDLTGNKLTRLDSNIFVQLPNTIIYLGFNPWTCDLSLEQQIHYIRAHPERGTNAICEYPDHLKGKLLKELPLNELCWLEYYAQCNAELYSAESSIIITIQKSRIEIVRHDNDIEVLLHGSRHHNTTVILYNGYNDILGPKQCHIISGNVIDGKDLISNQTYRLCRFSNGEKTVSMMDCVSFHTEPNITLVERSMPFDPNMWIPKNDARQVILYSLICNVGAFLMGIFLAYFVAILFPVVTRNPNENLYTEHSQRIQEVKDRL